MKPIDKIQHLRAHLRTLALASTIFAASSVQAQTDIPLLNGDFEATTANYFGGFDPTPDTTPGWSNYGTIGDGGVELNGWWGCYNNERSAFIVNGTGAYNTSAHTIQAGEVFTVGFVGKGWFNTSQIKVTLFYGAPSNVIGTFTQDVTGTYAQYFTPEMGATAGSVGGTLGVIIEKTGSNAIAFDEVTLSVSDATSEITFTQQPPESVSRFVGESLTLYASAISSDQIAFQWQTSTDDGTTWADVDGETGTSYTLFSLSYEDNGAQFRLNATNNTSGTVSSTVSTLTVSYPVPKVTKGFSGHTVVSGTTSDVTFTAEATGLGTLTFQWSKDGVVIPEAESELLTVNAFTEADTATYTLVITDDAATESSLPATTVTLTAQLTVVDPSATSVAYYRFEEGVNAAPLASAADSVGTNTMTGGGALTYSSTVPAATVPNTGAPNTLASVFPVGGTNGLVAPIDGTLATTTFTDFTIECYVKFEDLDGWQTFVGRDDSGAPGQSTGDVSLFYLQKMGDGTNRIRVFFNTATNNELEVNSGSVIPVAGQWYHVAAVGDSVAGTCTLYIDGTLVGSGTGFPGLRVPTAGSSTPWTIGRGQYGGNPGDYVHGSIDEVRFSRVALPVSEFLVPDPTLFTTWINANYPALSDKTAGGDPDHDGMTNDQEFAFGLDPSSGASVNPITALLNKTTGIFSYTRLNPAVSGRTYTIMTSTDLDVWVEDTGATAGQSVTATNDDVQTMSVTLSGAPLGESKLFIRVSAD